MSLLNLTLPLGGLQVALLERFYLPTAGSVLLDGEDIGSYDHRWLRRRMAIVSSSTPHPAAAHAPPGSAASALMSDLSICGSLQVSQEPVLYARSIRQNILYGLAENGIPSEEVSSSLAALLAALWKPRV